MPTKKSTSNPSAGNASKKKGSGKKRGSSKKQFFQDPPIIVGGGGSTWIWLPLGTPKITPTYIPDYVDYPDQYDCYEVSWNTKSIHLKDGKGGYKKEKPKDAKTHNTKFSKFE